MCKQEMFNKSRKIETLAYRLEGITEGLSDEYSEIKELSKEIKKEAFDNCEIANKLMFQRGD